MHKKDNGNDNNNTKNSSSSPLPSKHSEEEEMKSRRERLSRILQMLKISHDSQISERAFKTIEKAMIEETKTYGYWIVALNAIADSCLAIKHIFSLSEIYDFLTVAVATNIENEKRRRTKAIDDIIFKIYTDIMTNYQSSDDRLKTNYPKITVDVIAILAKGMDTKGKKTATYNVESYYQARKLNTSNAAHATMTSPTTVTTAAAAAAGIVSIKKEGKHPHKSCTLSKSKETLSTSSHSDDDDERFSISEEQQKELIETLNQITGRSNKSLEVSLANLQRIDIRRIRDICANYNKLKRYCELVSGSDNKFRVEIQKELGKKLTNHQLQHAANSIRKARQYIENLLDGKFVPHGSYGINHTKHNLEYGYQLIGVMQPSRRKGVKEKTTKK
jgi:RNase H-fold protein (predicted Holliday junction resolvase)